MVSRSRKFYPQTKAKVKCQNRWSLNRVTKLHPCIALNSHLGATSAKQPEKCSQTSMTVVSSTIRMRQPVLKLLTIRCKASDKSRMICFRMGQPKNLTKVRQDPATSGLRLAAKAKLMRCLIRS